MSPSLPAGYKLDPTPSMPDSGGGLPAGYKLDAAPAQPSALSRAGSAFWEGLGGPTISNIVHVALHGDQDSADQVTAAVKGVVNGLKGEPARVWSELSDTGKAMLAGHLADATYHLAGAVPLIGPGAQRVGQDAQQGNYAEAAGHA